MEKHGLKVEKGKECSWINERSGGSGSGFGSGSATLQLCAY
jgi:hypothetical protein